MSSMEKINPNEVPGTAQGAKTEAEIRHRIGKAVTAFGSSISSQISNAIADVDSKLSGTSDRDGAPKFPVDGEGISYLGGGFLTLGQRDGRMTLARDETARVKPTLQTEQGGTLFSNADATVLSTTKVSTQGGDVLNPLGVLIPSTHMSPNATWTKTFLPQLSIKDVVMLSMIEILQVSLLTALSDLRNDRDSPERRINVQNIDMATIIQDNKELENRMLGDNFRT